MGNLMRGDYENEHELLATEKRKECGGGSGVECDRREGSARICSKASTTRAANRCSRS
jgi:hypothetical protein